MKSPRSMLNVFVYGTLKPGEVNYQFYCQNKVRSHTPGYTRGNLYDLPLGYPGMTEGENKVQGVLLTFGDFGVLQDLDRLEGYQEQREVSLNEYYRQLVPVYSQKDEFLGKAYAYFMTATKVNYYGGTLLESGLWQG